jgi:DegV family protein with EDD domain
VIKVVTDSTCYLPAEMLTAYDIRVVPMGLLFGQEVYYEGVDIDIDQFFARLSQTPTMPTTSHPNLQSFVAAWQPLLDAGHEVITILLSSGLSGALGTAASAARLLGSSARISIVDSLSIAMGLGMQVLHAAEMAASGVGRAEIVSAIERMREAIHIVLVPDTLEYLHRGGRINTAQAWVGTLLRVKPMLALRKGVVEPLEKVRTAKRALSDMIDRTIAHLGNDLRPWISVMHSRTPEAAEEILRQLRARFPAGRFFSAEIGPVLGAHLGPGGSGIIACPSSAM